MHEEEGQDLEEGVQEALGRLRDGILTHTQHGDSDEEDEALLAELEEGSFLQAFRDQRLAGVDLTHAGRGRGRGGGGGACEDGMMGVMWCVCSIDMQRAASQQAGGGKGEPSVSGEPSAAPPSFGELLHVQSAEEFLSQARPPCVCVYLCVSVSLSFVSLIAMDRTG